jgi:hypothetical protein
MSFGSCWIGRAWCPASTNSFTSWNTRRCRVARWWGQRTSWCEHDANLFAAVLKGERTLGNFAERPTD